MLSNLPRHAVMFSHLSNILFLGLVIIILVIILLQVGSNCFLSLLDSVRVLANSCSGLCGDIAISKSAKRQT